MKRNFDLQESYERSRPVYKRAHGQRRPPLIPQNYSGNAFARDDEVIHDPVISDPESENFECVSEEKACELSCESCTQCAECSSNKEEHDKKENKIQPPSQFSSSLFGKSIGGEELLLLSLIFLLGQSGENTETLLYLVILLFI